jgi:hypothetical protein
MDTDESVVSNHFTYNDSDLPSQTDINAKKKFVRQIIDGSGHNVMDRSFNQSTFQGMINWSNNSDTSSEPDPNNS